MESVLNCIFIYGNRTENLDKKFGKLVLKNAIS